MDSIFEIEDLEMKLQEKLWKKQDLIRAKVLEEAASMPSGKDIDSSATSQWLDKWNQILSEQDEDYLEYAGGPGEWLVAGTDYSGAPHTELFSPETDLEQFHPDGSVYHDRWGFKVVVLASNYDKHRDWAVSHAEANQGTIILVHARDLKTASDLIPTARITAHCPVSNQFITMPRNWDHDCLSCPIEYETINKLGRWFDGPDPEGTGVLEYPENEERENGTRRIA